MEPALGAWTKERCLSKLAEGVEEVKIEHYFVFWWVFKLVIDIEKGGSPEGDRQ